MLPYFVKYWSGKSQTWSDGAQWFQAKHVSNEIYFTPTDNIIYKQNTDIIIISICSYSFPDLEIQI